RAQHNALPLRKMEHAGRPDDHREAERDEDIDAADCEATDKELDELRAAHRMFRSVVDHRPVVVGNPPLELKSAKLRCSEGRRPTVGRTLVAEGDTIDAAHRALENHSP